MARLQTLRNRVQARLLMRFPGGGHLLPSPTVTAAGVKGPAPRASRTLLFGSDRDVLVRVIGPASEAHRVLPLAHRPGGSRWRRCAFDDGQEQTRARRTGRPAD